jgi:hypothetical protein
MIKEGQILEYFINNQKKPKKQIANDLGMHRTNLYDIFSTTTLKPETKQKFEQYFNTEIFTEEYRRHVEQHYRGGDQSTRLQEEQPDYIPGSDYREKYLAQLQANNQDLKEYNDNLKEYNQDLKYTLEMQKKLIEKLEYQIKPSNNSEAKEKVGG